jgi:integrase
MTSEIGRPADLAVERHLDWLRMRGLAATTIRDRRLILTAAARTLGVPLADAGHDDLMAWRQGLTAWPSRRPLAAGVITTRVSALRQFYSWAIGDGLITGPNPAARIPVPRRPRRLPRPVPEADLMAAVDAAPPRVRLWLILAGWAGLRCKEIALLRRESILDTAAMPVAVITSDATKGRRERAVPLSPFVLAEIRRAGLPAAGWCFPRCDGQPGPNTPARVSELANDLLHGCGLATTMHALRHRFATAAYQASRDLRLVQELLGHADPQSTAGYAAIADADAAAAVAAIPVP